ncbi:MAG: methyltransferase domain-containing protein [Candidatus Peribacteria bacterium]|nr:MAG: methyltransferase domain-containing protein [Candidatus Peribacteria bacterium]
MELACGRGYNLSRIAQHTTAQKYIGLDLSNVRLQYSWDKQDMRLEYVQGDFHDLSRFADATIDFVYIIEALCHSANKLRVFEEIYRVLKPGGKCMVIDGYAASHLSSLQEFALALTARGMAVEQVETYEQVLAYATQSGLHVSYEKEKSREVLPSMRRLKRKTRWL